MLTLVPTPIGNLQDITIRALETLKSCDAIICEDSRRTGLLLHHFMIEKPLIVLNDIRERSSFNPHKNSDRTPDIITRLQAGQHLCLVSDAGTPLISDPGYKLVREALAQNIKVDSLPGPSAAITALTLSGLPPDKFTFLGYLPEKPGNRQKIINNMMEISQVTPMTFILFVAPHKLIRTLEEMKELLGDQEIVLAKELTKIYQKVKQQKISQWLIEFKQLPRGEWVLLIHLPQVAS